MIFLEDRENMFILRGYDVYVHCGETLGSTYLKPEIARVIELIKYYDQEFIPDDLFSDYKIFPIW